MAEENTSVKTSQQKSVTDVKGKGKAVEEKKPIAVEDEEMDDEEEDEDEEMDEVDDDDAAEPEDDLEEIDPTNIVSRRTRGKKIDYAKEAEAAGNDLEEDDDDDEEYVAPVEEEK